VGSNVGIGKGVTVEVKVGIGVAVGGIGAGPQPSTIQGSRIKQEINFNRLIVVTVLFYWLLALFWLVV
jgi:hypothetical protein